jgi:hypothetical protein
MINQKYNKNLILLKLAVPPNHVSVAKFALIKVGSLIGLIDKLCIERLINTKQ